MSVALITGITGQDGSYLAELLLEKGYKVVGLVRDREAANNIVLPVLRDSVELVEWNMQDQQAIIDTLKKYKPREIYNLAAYSSGSGMFENPIGMMEINGLAVTRILDAIREVDCSIRFCQASSREIYGNPDDSPQSENTTPNPRSPYGAAKLYADNMIKIYRKEYGLYACSAILFNHESPRRGLGFVTRKITHEASRIKLGYVNELRLGNLDVQRDWCFAGDVVRAMWMMLQADMADDYVIASGVARSVRKFCESAFSYLGLDYSNYIVEDAKVYRPAEDAILVGDANKAENVLNWMPETGFTDLVHMMVDEDLKKLQNS